MPSIPPSAYQVTTPNRTPRPSTTQQVSSYKATSPFRAAPPPPPSVTTQPVSRFKPTSPFRAAPPPSTSSLSRAAKFFSKVPKGGGAALAIALELFFPPPAGDNYYRSQPQKPAVPIQATAARSAQFTDPPRFLFRNGQSKAYYRVDYTGVLQDQGAYTRTIYVYGPISSEGNIYKDIGNGFGQQYFSITCYAGDGTRIVEQLASTNYVKTKTPIPYTNIVNITRVDKQPDTGGDPPPLSPGTLSPPGNYLGPPSAAPPSTAPSPAPKAPPPFGFPGSSPSGAPGGFPGSSPGDQPKRFSRWSSWWIPKPRPPTKSRPSTTTQKSRAYTQPQSNTCS